MYKLGTKKGELKGVYSRTQSEPLPCPQYQMWAEMLGFLQELQKTSPHKVVDKDL